MDIFKTPLEIIFKDQNPYYILDNYYKKNIKANNDFKKIDKKHFVNLLDSKEKQLSRDECINIYEIVNEYMSKSFEGCNFEKSVFNLLAYYNSDKLVDCGYTARCRYKELLKWRMVTLKLDADMFICSFFAYKDLLRNYNRKNFDWETIIKSDNIRLHEMLSAGMADNHFHLNGSAPTFKLTWTSLMNNVYSAKSPKINFYLNRLEKDIDGDVNIAELIVIAAIIRAILFSKLVGNKPIDNDKDVVDKDKTIEKPSEENDDEQVSINNQSSNNAKNLNEILKEFIKNRQEYGNNISEGLLSFYTDQIQNEIESLKFIYGSNVMFEGIETKVDYTITKEINKSDMGMRFFIGERWFLYNCFKHIYTEDKSDKVYQAADLFYVYLIIKNRIRAELIQENDKVGYSNFDEYQYRKTKYIPSGTLLKDSVEPLAILTSIKTQNIKALEARITPENTVKENREFIRDKDKLICKNVFYDYNNYWVRKYNNDIQKDPNNELNEYERIINEEKQLKIDNDFKKKYCYIIHFPKYEDNIGYLENDYKNIINKCRHFEYREKLKNWAKVIYLMRENSQLEAKRILGIDACSNELLTRPEVFGQTFRFLKDHLPEYDYLSDYYGENRLQRIRATYHVGEDFFDVVDGLRAIDEAIKFLNLTHGDRLGHAVVLGIDVGEWYEKKCNRVYLSKQDILDNVAWLICKIKKYDITAGPDTIDKLIAIYNKYYSEIYIMKNENYNPSTEKKSRYTYGTDRTVVPIDIYNKSWQLRGDNPEYYLGGNSNTRLTLWDRYAINKPEYNGVVCELYHRYHYDNSVKEKGYEKEVFRIYPYMIDAIKEVQSYMKKSICYRGIGIETNPTSNVLINTFKRYDKHPILNMFNLGLANSYEEENEVPQLFVSINTDDQGVFDTLLENEYALMGIALEKVKNKNGQAKYKQAKIYDWLDKIRRMGLEQSFRR